VSRKAVQPGCSSAALRDTVVAGYLDSSGGISSQMRRRYLLRGVYVSGGLLLCVAIIAVVNLVIAYDGKCGGYFPGLSARRSCSLWEYLSGDMVAIAMVVLVALWPLVLTLLALPPLVGYLLDRRARRNAA
jgi:hypothetical protein